MKTNLSRLGLLNSTIRNTNITRSIKPCTNNMFYSSSKTVTEKKLEQLPYRDPEKRAIDEALANSNPETAKEHFDRARGLTLFDEEYAADAAYHFRQAAALDPEKYKNLSEEAISSLIKKYGVKSENSMDDLIMQLPEKYEKVMEQINKPAQDIIEREFAPLIRAIEEEYAKSRYNLGNV